MAAALFRSSTASSFDGLYRRHVASVYRYAFAVVGNHADAEDITQQTFLNAYRAMAQGTKPRKAENWLLTIAHNEVRRHFRDTQKKGNEVEFDEQLAPAAPEPSDHGVADVLRALRHIPPSQREALVMREFEGRSYAEIAGIMGLSERALETLIFRARRSLAEQLEGALTCAEAEEAFMRRLDGRLPRRESRRLRRHVKDCLPCARFGRVQKQQRSLLKGLSVMPVPASIFLFRGETAAAAGTASVAAGAGATGIATGLVVKAAAVTAAAVVAGGVGYEVAVAPEPAAKVEPKAVQRVEGQPASVRVAIPTLLVLEAKVRNSLGARATVVRQTAKKSKPVHADVPPGQAKVKEHRDGAVGAAKTRPGQAKPNTNGNANGAAKERPVKAQGVKRGPVRARPAKIQPKKTKPAKPVLEKAHPAKPVKPPPPAAGDRGKPDQPVDPSATAPEPKRPSQEGKADHA